MSLPVRVVAAFGGMASLLAACLFAASAGAQTYPAKPIRIYVGFPAGGGPDLIARMIGARLTESWGQPVIVENKPGASGGIAAEYASKTAPDGYSLLLSSSGPMTLNAFIFGSVPYDSVKDFAPVSTFGLFPLMLAVHPELPVQSPRELFAYAKANPGKLNNGASAVSMQLAMEMLNQMAGLNIVTVRYKGSAAAVNALIRGEVQLTILESTPLLPQIRAGKARALAIMSDARISAMPEIATIAESGVPGYAVTFWTGVFAPAGTPQPIVARLGAELAKMIEVPEVRERMKAMGAEPVAEPAARLAARISSDMAKYAPVVKSANLKAD